MIWARAAAALCLLLATASPGHAHRRLNLTCSVQAEWCQAVVATFQRDTGARNAAQAQRLGFKAGGQLQTPSNRAAPLPPGAPDLNALRLIDYDFVRYGRSAERQRLIERWEREVGALPR